MNSRCMQASAGKMMTTKTTPVTATLVVMGGTFLIYVSLSFDATLPQMVPAPRAWSLRWADASRRTDKLPWDAKVDDAQRGDNVEDTLQKSEGVVAEAGGLKGGGVGGGCPSVLTAVRQGSWHQSMTDAEKRDMVHFYRQKNEQGEITPFYLQREDSRCGNVSFRKQYSRWRASCNPDGPTPCCYDNVCVNKTTAECTCRNCLDMRTMVFAEHATWRPADKRCPLVPMTRTDVCELLDGRTVLVVGDSLMRHFYIGFLMVVRGDEDNGAFPAGVPEETRRHCHGKTMFLRGHCAGVIDYTAKLCKGRANARYVSFYHPSQGISVKQMIGEVASALTRNGSIAVLGIGSHYRRRVGSHFKLEPDRAINDSLVPLLHRLTAAEIPINHRLLWTSIHAKKNFKVPDNEKTFKEMLLRFNARTEKVMRSWNVPVFDTFNMTTQKVMGVDSSHYGLGVQRAKVNLLFHYLLELRNQGLW